MMINWILVFILFIQINLICLTLLMIYIYNAGLDNDQFVLVANSNKSCQVAVKAPWGTLTKRETLKNIEMQGGVLTPLKCSVQIDTIGKETMSISECSKSMFKYKDCVKIPVLSFIDDAISITECGPDSVKANAYIQSKVNTKKLNYHKASALKCILEMTKLCAQL